MALSITIATAITVIRKVTENPIKEASSFEIIKDSLMANRNHGQKPLPLSHWMAVSRQKQLLRRMQGKDSLEARDMHTLKEIDLQLNQMLYER